MNAPDALVTHRSLCIVIHDVAPQTWPRCQTLLDKLAAIGDFRVTLLAIPRNRGAPRNPAFEAWLKDRASRGDEIALHGYTHLDDGTPNGWIDRLRRQVYTRGEGEFWDLPLPEAQRRIDAGLAWLRSLGIVPAGFVAPAWLMGEAAWKALASHAFEYTCTLKRIYPLPAVRGVTGLSCQAQVYSSTSAWRRWSSVMWCEALAWLQRGNDIVRLELHPVDVQAPVHRSWQRLARYQLKTRRVETLDVIARRLRVPIRTAPASTSP